MAEVTVEIEQNGFLKAEVAAFSVSDFFKSDSFMVSKVFFQVLVSIQRSL